MSYDIQKLIEWQRKGDRQIDIRVGSSRVQDKEISIWVYDYSINGGTGTRIQDPDQDFDLQAVADEKEKHELARLTEKYRESGESEQ